jgi:hypothetical protein
MLFLQLRPVAVYHPGELACYRYRNSKAPVDFLAIVNPLVRNPACSSSLKTALHCDRAAKGGCWLCLRRDIRWEI